MTGPIDEYLDDLWVQLRRLAPRDARSLLSEAESHLRDAAAASSLPDPDEAERAAVASFGGAKELVAADRNRTKVDLLRGVILSAWWLGAVGAIAVGLSGVIAGIMRAVGASNQWLAGGSTKTLTPSACSRWLNLYPHAGSCGPAALADWAAETVAYRIAFGLLGVLALGLLAVARRRLRLWKPLPSAVVDTIATTAFGGAGVWLAVAGIDALTVSSGHGAGQWLSAAPIALAAGLAFGLRLVKDLSPAAA